MGACNTYDIMNGCSLLPLRFTYCNFLYLFGFIVVIFLYLLVFIVCSGIAGDALSV